MVKSAPELDYSHNKQKTFCYVSRVEKRTGSGHLSLLAPLKSARDRFHIGQESKLKAETFRLFVLNIFSSLRSRMTLPKTWSGGCSRATGLMNLQGLRGAFATVRLESEGFRMFSSHKY